MRSFDIGEGSRGAESCRAVCKSEGGAFSLLLLGKELRSWNRYADGNGGWEANEGASSGGTLGIGNSL